jgi:hypothetical protein
MNRNGAAREGDAVLLPISQPPARAAELQRITVNAVISHATYPTVNDLIVLRAGVVAATADDLIARADARIQAGDRDLASAVDHWLAAGDDLHAAKELAGHGHWLEHLEKRGISADKAERYMFLADHRAELDSARVQILSMAAARRYLKNLEKNPPPSLPPPTAGTPESAEPEMTSPVTGDPDEAARLTRRAEHTVETPIIGSWAARPTTMPAPPASTKPDLSNWLARDKADRCDFLRAALGTIELDDLLAALPSDWKVEIDQRVVDRRAAARSPLSEKLTKTLRSALSHSRTDHGRNDALASLRAIHKMLAANGLDLHDVEVAAELKPKQKKANAA